MSLATRDKAVIWHPYTQHQTVADPLPIKQGKGAYLMGENDKCYLDLISSWWVNLHGHAHPEIAKAIYEQAMMLEHVIFAAFTHEPAVSLAEKIIALLPTGFSKTFYSDNGSTAVEVALKMAYQYWRNQGQGQRKRIIAFEQGYHGDTVGAMSVSRKSGFFAHFEDLLFTVDMFPYPSTWHNDPLAEIKSQHVIAQLSNYLDKYADETAALIIEPLVQGAGGMRMCAPAFLRDLESLLRSHGVLIIYDEVMTGFGRTGSDFACITAQTTPDIICLAKGITGGCLPLAMTACQQYIYEAFLGDTFAKALSHGHSFTANPLGCAAGLASLALLQKQETRQQIEMIARVHQQFLPVLSSIDLLEKPRQCGTIMAFDLKTKADYGSQWSSHLQARFLELGLLIRPLGNVIYFLPPYCVTEAELTQAYRIVIQEIQKLGVTA